MRGRGDRPRGGGGDMDPLPGGPLPPLFPRLPVFRQIMNQQTNAENFVQPEN